MTAVLEFDGLTFTEDAGVGLHLFGLKGWWDSPNPKLEAEDRPQGDGYYEGVKVYRDGRPVTVEGSYLGTSIVDAQRMRLRLAALQADGKASPFRVADESGALTARMQLAGKVVLPDQLYSEWFEFSFQVSSADPYRYGDVVPVSTGLASRGTGIVFPLAAWTGTINGSPSVESVGGVETRRNLVIDPAATSNSWYSRWFGSGTTAGTYESVTNADDGPVNGPRSYARKTWTTASAAGANGNTGFNVASAPQPVTPGEPLVFSGWFRSNLAGLYGVVAKLQWVMADGSYNVAIGPATPIPANTWVRLSVAATVPPGATGAYPLLDVDSNATAYPVGTRFDATGALLERGSEVRPYFDGSRAEGVTFPLSFGEPGSTGRATAVNGGSADTFSVFTVAGGRFEGGFTLVHVESGRQIRVDREIPMGSTVVIDSRKGTVLLDGTSPIPGSLTRSEWWPVPAGGTATVQFLANGATSGTPTLTVATAPASL